MKQYYTLVALLCLSFIGYDAKATPSNPTKVHTATPNSTKIKQSELQKTNNTIGLIDRVIQSSSQMRQEPTTLDVKKQIQERLANSALPSEPKAIKAQLDELYSLQEMLLDPLNQTHFIDQVKELDQPSAIKELVQEVNKKIMSLELAALQNESRPAVKGLNLLKRLDEQFKTHFSDHSLPDVMTQEHYDFIIEKAHESKKLESAADIKAEIEALETMQNQYDTTINNEPYLSEKLLPITIHLKDRLVTVELSMQAQSLPTIKRIIHEIKAALAPLFIGAPKPGESHLVAAYQEMQEHAKNIPTSDALKTLEKNKITLENKLRDVRSAIEAYDAMLIENKKRLPTIEATLAHNSKLQRAIEAKIATKEPNAQDVLSSRILTKERDDLQAEKDFILNSKKNSQEKRQEEATILSQLSQERKKIHELITKNKASVKKSADTAATLIKKSQDTLDHVIKVLQENNSAKKEALLNKRKISPQVYEEMDRQQRAIASFLRKRKDEITDLEQQIAILNELLISSQSATSTTDNSLTRLKQAFSLLKEKIDLAEKIILPQEAAE